MKTVTIIILSIYLNACSGNKELASNINKEENTTEQSAKAKMQEEELTLSYSASSRGFFNSISVTKNSTTYQLSHSDKKVTIPTPKKDWDALMEALGSTTYKSITTLEAPSTAHQYDGAAGANFAIVNKAGKTFRVPTFDAGNPNKAIAPVIKKLLALMPSKK